MIKYLENEKDFEELTKNRCLVDFYADWCGPCQRIGEEFEAIENNIDIVKVNTDKFETLCTKFGIMSIPALFIMEDGKVIKKSIGFLNKEELLEFIKEEK